MHWMLLIWVEPIAAGAVPVARDVKEPHIFVSKSADHGYKSPLPMTRMSQNQARRFGGSAMTSPFWSRLTMDSRWST